MIQNFTVDEAAEKLRCKPRFLTDNLHRLPHQKIGVAVVFDEGDLAKIQDMHRVRPRDETSPPANAQQTDAAAMDVPDRALSLGTIRPSQRRRTSARS